MPLSEFLRMASRKTGSGQHKPTPTDLASRPDHDLFELLFENGEITMQGQSSRPTRTSPPNALPPNANKARTGKLSGVDSMLHDMSPIVVPSRDLDLSQDDDMSPWLDSLTQDYGSVLFPEISDVAPGNNGMLAQNSCLTVDKRGSSGQAVSNLQQSGFGSSKALYSKDRLLCSRPPPPPQHRQTSDTLGSGFSGIVSKNHTGNHSRPDVLSGNPAQSRDIGPRTNNSLNYLNFSHFARSANVVKSNVPNSVKEKDSAGSGINPKVVKSTRVEGVNSVSSGQPVVTKATKDSCPSENLYQEMSVVNGNPSTQSNDTELAKGVPCRERIVEQVVASSSVGSGNSADRVSCEQTHNSKRKRDTEDSEGRSEDIGTEFVDVEKTTLAGGNNGGSKRSRAAEVHNLSERRRRDRINEKMRALQELIPNCNKADKASMLDEAIEYLKTLQLQVQILSMGPGLCMPQMMFPPGMQHMHPAHIPHFSPMGPVGMGMGIGMGMVDINGGCPGFPMSPLHAPQFSASLPANFQRMPSPNLPVYGHPFQGIPLTGNSAMELSGLRNGSQSAAPRTSPVLKSGDVTNMNSQFLNCYTEANQLHTTAEVLNQSDAVQENKHATNASGLSTMTPTTATDISKAPCDQ